MNVAHTGKIRKMRIRILGRTRTSIAPFWNGYVLNFTMCVYDIRMKHAVAGFEWIRGIHYEGGKEGGPPVSPWRLVSKLKIFQIVIYPPKIFINIPVLCLLCLDRNKYSYNGYIYYKYSKCKCLIVKS